MSIADSILKYGEMRDITTIPSFPVKSSQNGIVFVHLILSLIGLSSDGRILSIVIINYLLYLSGVYPLYKIAKMSGLRNDFSLAALLSVYMGAWHIYRINLIAYNDGIFNSMMLWLVYLIIGFIQLNENSHSKPFSRSYLKRFICITIILLISVHFRLNAFLVIGSALLSAIAVRNYWAASWFLIVCITLIISFFSVYLFVDVVRFNNSLDVYFFPLFTSINVSNIKFQLWKILPRLLAGLSGLTNPFSTLIFSIFPLSVIFYGFKGLIERNFNKVFLASLFFSGLWFTMSFKNARVIWYIFPFIYLILLSFKRVRYVGYAFILMVFLQSLQQFYIGFRRGPDSKLWLHIYEEGISIPDQALLSAYSTRHPYFFLDSRSYLGDDSWREIQKLTEAPGKFMPKLNWDLLSNHGSLFVIGDRTYIDSTLSQVSEMASINGHDLISKALTPGLDEFEGWGLFEMKLNKNINNENKQY